MQAEEAPPGFWPWPDRRAALVDGVEIESAVPTRFFQTPDRFPQEWGRVSWRVQLNRLESECATAPRFRTFYSGVEWNLRVPGGRWFLTAWLRCDAAWDGEPAVAPAVRIEGDTVHFAVGPLFLRTRVDARDRRTVAQAIPPADRDGITARNVIVLDDLLGER